MLNNFKKTLDLMRHANFNHANMHISFKEHEISTIDDIINYAHDKPDGEKHIEFLQGYKSQIEGHISLIKHTISESETLADRLTKFLNEVDKDEFTKNDRINIGSHTMYISYYKGEFTFITPITHDSHLLMDMYIIFTYAYNGKKFSLQGRKIGYTDETLNNLRSHPSLLVQEIEKMDTLADVSEVNAQFTKCETLFEKLFHLKNFFHIFSFNDPYYTKLFGDPQELMSLMIDKRLNNVITLQLEQNNVRNVTPDLIALILAENRYKKHVFDEEFDTQEAFEERKEKLKNEKNSLMINLQLDQDLLDTYMSFINLEI